MTKVVVLTGAGMSADSGLETFRNSNGLWEEHDIKKVATVDAWHRNKEYVLNFYNKRRRRVHSVEPNKGHHALAQLEGKFDVTIVTQNIDNLHERAGSSDVVHLHGEISKVRSENDASLIYDIGGQSISLGDTAEDGAQLRPHVVWFGERVPQMEIAFSIVAKAEIFIVIGTSLAVYPAAGLIDLARESIPKFIIDPSVPDIPTIEDWEHKQKRAAVGTPELVEELMTTQN